MSAHQNPVVHPDENLLAAFAEQALTGAERESVLAHVSGCARCRDVVFMAQESAAPAEAVPAIAMRPARRHWLRWQTATAGAWVLALIIGSVLLWHRRENVPPRNQQAFVRPGEPPTVAGPEKRAQEQTAPAPASPVAPARQAVNGPISAEKKLLEKRKDTLGARNENLPLASTASGMQAQSYIAPPAGAPQQQAAIANGGLRSLPITGNQQIPKQTNQKVLQEAPASPVPPPPPEAIAASNELAAAKPAPSSASRRVSNVSAESETVSVSAEPELAVVSPGLPQFSIKKGKLERLAVGGYRSIALPAGTQARSIASYSNVILLLTRQRSLYRSVDLGDHWLQVRAQWDGKPKDLRLRMEGAGALPQNAVAKRTYDAIESNQARAAGGTAGGIGAGVLKGAPQSSSLDSKTSSPPAAGAIFELTNSAGKRWLSRDGGQTWQPE